MKNTRTKVDINHTIITHADLLAQRHEDYVSEFVTRANTELYCILAEILELHEKLSANPKKEQLIKQMRQSLKEKYGLKTQANTKTTALVVKYVTRASRKTAHVYGRVLEVAIANGISSAGLIDFIKSSGGIDKIRLAVASKETQKQLKAIEIQLHKQLRTELWSKTDLASVAFADSIRLPHAKDVSFTHMLCTYNHKTKKHEVVGIMYPCSNLETMAINNYLTMLEVASISDDQTLFYQQCKEHGLNMDLMHRWMSSNGITSPAAARSLMAELENPIKSTHNTINKIKQKLAA